MTGRDASAGALEDALRELVHSAPACTRAQLEEARRAALEVALGAASAGEDRALGLACAIERVVALLPRGQVDAAAALPALVMAAAALGAGDGAISAAWYEVDTLLPVPGRAARRAGGPDVPVARLTQVAPSPSLPSAPDHQGEEEDDEADEPWRWASAGWPQELCNRVLDARRRARH